MFIIDWWSVFLNLREYRCFRDMIMEKSIVSEVLLFVLHMRLLMKLNFKFSRGSISFKMLPVYCFFPSFTLQTIFLADL